jgi:hypothetical protein
MISRVDYTALPSSFHSPSLFRGAPTHSRSPGARASESNNSGGRKGDHTSIYDVATVPGRVHRARTAFTIAGTLCLVDGPLPVGDIAAATLLIAYGSYEVFKSASIIFG